MTFLRTIRLYVQSRCDDILSSIHFCLDRKCGLQRIRDRRERIKSRGMRMDPVSGGSESVRELFGLQFRVRALVRNWKLQIEARRRRNNYLLQVIKGCRLIKGCEGLCSEQAWDSSSKFSWNIWTYGFEV